MNHWKTSSRIYSCSSQLSVHLSYVTWRKEELILPKRKPPITANFQTLSVICFFCGHLSKQGSAAEENLLPFLARDILTRILVYELSVTFGILLWGGKPLYCGSWYNNFHFFRAVFLCVLAVRKLKKDKGHIRSTKIYF